ncbi:Macro_Poa1p_like domain-containing protein [Pseudomonas phage EM]|uniref:Macro_Poa1p_like domain-containing protein n=1 Tax=Pseudomonas phage EM TaxID=2936914 RepID=A0AAE9KU52_9CAUD|nr:Macro_Poa1p_like domain-containing protein [Pseudomonas phage EM]UPW35826.1 Macro_Poa1p_like domain-containing protein [Pseudomonas phage EM]
MIKYRKGDLLAAFKNRELHAIAHQANCFNTMGSGIARQIKEQFPEAYEADQSTEKGDRSKLGSLTFTVNEYGSIYNLYGQYDYGRDNKVYTKIDALGRALYTMSMFLSAEAGARGIPEAELCVGLPKIGCGLAGEDWENVAPLIEEFLGQFQVYVYELE